MSCYAEAGKGERDRAAYISMFCAENITPHLRTTDDKTRNCQPGGYFNLYLQGFTLREREMEMGLPDWSEFQIQAT
jgi:hypothetical protein